MAGAGNIIEIFMKRSLIEAVCKNIGVDGVTLTGLGILIMVKPGRSKAIELVVENMFPFQIDIPVAIFIKRIAVEAELVIAEIAGKINFIFNIHLVAYFKLDVIA